MEYFFDLLLRIFKYRHLIFKPIMLPIDVFIYEIQRLLLTSKFLGRMLLSLFSFQSLFRLFLNEIRLLPFDLNLLFQNFDPFWQDYFVCLWRLYLLLFRTPLISQWYWSLQRFHRGHGKSTRSLLFILYRLMRKHFYGWLSIQFFRFRFCSLHFYFFVFLLDFRRWW